MEKKTGKETVWVRVAWDNSIICFTNSSDDPQDQKQGALKEVYSAITGKTVSPNSSYYKIRDFIKSQKKGLTKKASKEVRGMVSEYLSKEFGYDIDFAKNNPLFESSYLPSKGVKGTLRDCVEQNIADYLNGIGFFGEGFTASSDFYFLVDKLKKKVDGDFYENYKEAVARYIYEELTEDFVTVNDVKYINEKHADDSGAYDEDEDVI